MGTTLTTNLGLIIPDADEKIQEDLPTYDGWASQNADNMDNVDRLFRFTNTTYVPVLTAIGGAHTLGAGGFITGKYMRVMPSLVVGHILFYAGGAGFVAGVSDYRISVPLAMEPDIAALTDTIPVGKGILYDDSAAATSSVLVVLYHVASNTFVCRDPSGGPFGATSPITLAQQDRFSLYFCYPTSVA